MKFKKGQSGNPNGRPPGPNTFTVAAKQAFNAAFQGLGGVEELIEWGKKNRTEFYKLYARLIPVEVAGSVGIYDARADAEIVRSKLLQAAIALPAETTTQQSH